MVFTPKSGGLVPANWLIVVSAAALKPKEMSANGSNAIGPAEMLQLNREFSREEVHNLVLMFSDEGSLLVGRMETAIGEDDNEALGRAAHALRGAGINFGARVLNELCQQIEAFAAAKDFQQATTLLLQVREEFSRVETALRKECDYGYHE